MLFNYEKWEYIMFAKIDKDCMLIIVSEMIGNAKYGKG